MKPRFGLVMSAALSLVLGACASGGTGGAATATSSGAASMEGAEVLAQGERPRNDDFTESAQEHLEMVEEGMPAEEARVHYQAAVEAAEQGIAADSTNPLAYRLAGEAYLGLGNYQMAGEMLDEAERLRPIYQIETERIRELAWIDRYQEAAPLVNAGEYEAAIEVFEQANAIYQGRPEVMLTLGQVYAQTGQHDLALQNLRSAQEIIESERIEEMDSATAANWQQQGEALPVMIAQSLVNAGRFDEAATALNALLAEDPENVGYLRTLGTTLVRMEQPDSAQVIFDRILAIDGLDSQEYYAVAVGLYQSEEFVKAADAFEQAADASVNDRDAIEMWARSLQVAYPAGEDAPEPPAGALEELQGASQRWVDLDPYNQNAYLILAQTSNRLGDGDMARDLVAQIEQLPVRVENLQLARAAGGGGVVTGGIRNLTMDQGSTVTMTVTFYDSEGNAIGTQDSMIQMPAQDALAPIRVEFTGDEYVGGYSYELSM